MGIEKVFVKYPNLGSSTRNSDPCVRSDVYSKCNNCMIFITSERFLGDEQQKKFVKSSRKHPYVIIADTLGCNLRCWFCYSHHFWTLKTAKKGCNPVFLSSDEIGIRKIKYPYRWKFKVLHILDSDKWNKESISLRGLNVQFYSGINPI